MNVERLLTPASRIFHSTHFFPLLKLHGRADEIHLELRGMAGNDLPVLASAVRETADGEALNHCALITMVRRREFEAALVHARRAAEAATAAKDEFLAVVSHELRTPLSAIVGWVRLARSGKLDATMLQRAMDTIDRNAQMQAQLIEDLLDVSRIVSGKLRISPRAIDLPPVVEAAIDTSRPAAQAKGVELIVRVDRDAGIVHADPARMQQIVWNLVANAIKFTPKGGRVQVELVRASSRARVRVADTGRGIEPAQLPYLFDRFWQADAALQREHGGLGLGLSICKSLVELHGGSIRAESNGLGAGSVFTVDIPLAVATAGVAGLPPDHAQAEAESPLAGLRVLVVDDEADARGLMKMLLAGAGADCETASTVDEGLEAVVRQRPHAVVSDIGMSGKDGFDFIRALRTDPRYAAVGPTAIAVTGMARAQDRVNLLRAGFQALLVKPVEPAEVVAMVAALTRRG